ncbi:MAG: mechanosensitive ion channel [Bacteroides sp.]|nr:mechanosensitive ion channel [Bacteroides sp.]
MSGIIELLNEFLLSLGMSQAWVDRVDRLILLIVIIGLAFLVEAIVRVIVLQAMDRISKKVKSATVREILVNKKIFGVLLRIIAPILILSLIPMMFTKEATVLTLVSRLCYAYIIYVVIRMINFVLATVFDIYSMKEEFKDRPLKGLLQTGQTIVYFIGGIIIISVLIGKNASDLFIGLGASAAVLMLVFQDSILGVVAGIQLSANNMLRVGDWIAMPKYNLDGNVIEVTLNTVKVQNFDKTITTVPPYALVKDSFQNYRGMQDSGGRRVKRSINIDLSSIQFCTPEMLEEFKKIDCLVPYLESKAKEIEAFNEKHPAKGESELNMRRQTNLGIFRAYIDAYLRQQLSSIQQEGFTFLVRQLQPTEYGIPMELYFFTKTTVWAEYEGIQGDVFDHILASVPNFGLSIYQAPSGEDIRELKELKKQA